MNAPYLELDSPTGKYYGSDHLIYRVPDGLIHAANTAISVRRPLLITGESGSGKTEFAFAAARFIASRQNPQRPWDPDDKDHGLLQYYARSENPAKELIYSFDTMRRFADAYIRSTALAAELNKKAQDPRNYVQIGPLGQAIISANQRVLLIDELDKADKDIPGDLIRSLENFDFEINEIHDGIENKKYTKHMKGKPNNLLVIITTNYERPLSRAFVKRCVYYDLPFPDDEQLMQILDDKCQISNERDINKYILPRRIPGVFHKLKRTPRIQLFEAAIAIFKAVRRVPQINRQPSVCELIDWVRLMGMPGAKLEGFRKIDIPINVLQTPKKNPWIVRNFSFIRDLEGGMPCLVKHVADLEVLKVYSDVAA